MNGTYVTVLDFLEYDALARIIAEQPDRKETHSKLRSLGDQIGNLEKTKQELQMKLEKRHKQFNVLLSAAHQMQQIIKSKYFYLYLK